MVLGWLYYKDHPVEWRRFVNGADFLGRSDYVEYLEKHVPHFKTRRSALTDGATRSVLEPYHVLSKHVHSQTLAAIPAFGSLAALISGADRCREAVVVQGVVTEYLSDILTAVYADEWHDLPEEIACTPKVRDKVNWEKFWNPVAPNAKANRSR
jgi:hypothetical protein